ncbi:MULTISPECIES: ATPase domain-containing protein [unclassified Thioalkalivibrio]|uniref:ATPase domain-containing protein n=1 Tax=unclassified Thioalkalivibrio TaxID=2621013 RepID=UPI00037C1592|nr:MULTISPECIES: ATPase domain-containing protein [unclassified Thioalkalivibrio]
MDTSTSELQKRETGIAGLDSATRGGLPTGQATLVLGQPAAGKTVLCLQILARAVERGEGGVFVTFEESPAQVRRDAASFDWGAGLLDSDRWQLIDARPHPGAETAGEFDIEGLLSGITAAAGGDASWVIFDGIDQLLQLQPNRHAAIEQIRRINDHCENHNWAVLLTGKARGASQAPAWLEGIEFLLSSSLLLSAHVAHQKLNRSLRITKYRGSAHVTDEMPMLLDDQGVQLPYHEIPPLGRVAAGSERLSTGIPRLDSLLGGGIFRGSSLLISGRPGTAKSTLAGSFAEARAREGERVLYISFDELEATYVRNLASVGIDLATPIARGAMRFQDFSAYASSVTEHFLALRRLVDNFSPDCLVIDPVSALLKATSTEGAHLATEQLVDLARRRGITTILTALSGVEDPEGEATLGDVSTLADTWIVVGYNERGGERNRSLSIVKSRGSAHSNQQRELILSDSGLDLADAYESGSEVLMGTARAIKEREDREHERQRQLERERRRLDLEQRILQTQAEQRRLEAERDHLGQISGETDRLEHNYREDIRRRRDPDHAPGSADHALPTDGGTEP